MTTREVENFMLGVDDIDGSSIDAVFNHLDGNSGTKQQAPRAPFDFRAPSGPARSTQFERPTTTPEWSPEPQRQRAAPKPESEPLRTTVAVEEPLSDYDFASQIEALSRELDTTTALAPYDKTRTTALAKPVSEVTTADLTAPVAPPQFADPVIQTRTVTETTVAEPQLSGQRALAPKIIVRGQTTTVIDPTQEPQLQPQRAPQPQPTKPATKIDEEQPHPRRHREEGGMSPAEEEKRHRKEENRDAKIIEKHALELRKPHRKGGGKLGHQKIHDLLGDDGDVLGDTEGHTTEG
jgi:hypothetical protein